MSDVREFFRAQTINRQEFLDWFNWFGAEGAQDIVRMRFLFGEEARVMFAKAILPEGYHVARGEEFVPEVSDVPTNPV